MPSIKRAEEILEDYGYTFLLVSVESLGVYAMPTSYIFNENGKIVETFVGVIEWDSEEIISKLKML